MFKKSKKLSPKTITHNFNGVRNNDQITITGSYDVNIWYSYDNDTKTAVTKETNTYQETVNVKKRDDEEDNEQIIVRSLKQPTCTKIDIDNNKINYIIEKELGIELVGDIKVKIEANEEEDPWDEIIEEPKENNLDEQIENEVDEQFIKDKDIV